MSKLRFIRTSDTSAFHPLEWNGRRVLEAFEQLRAYLEAKGDSGLVGLLAEPVLAGGRGAALGSVAWYTLAEGDIVPLAQATAVQQREATRQLIKTLQPVSSWLAEPTIGPLLQRAFVVATVEDILLVGDRVVLTNWGLAPPPATASTAGLRQHFEATLGRYVLLPWPSSAEPAAVEETGSTTPPLAGETSAPPVPEPPPKPRRSIAPEPKPISPVPSSPPRPAWYQHPWAWALSGTLLLACGILLGLLVRFMGGRPPVSTAAANDLLSLQQGVNQSLEEQIARLRKALSGDACTTESSPLLLPSPTQSPLLPAQGDPAPTPGDQPAKTLAQRLEETTVLVLAPQAEGLSMGTGFLVAPGIILSNSHVVGTPAPNTSIVVTGKALGGLRKAQLLNATPLSGSRDSLNTPDFALLKLVTGTTTTPLPLTVEVEKLEPVVTAGFPGFELRLDPKFAALLDKGEISAVPEMVVSSGEISVVRGGGDDPTVIAHTAIVSQGNSGGPLVDRCGRVIGINTLIRLDDDSRRQGNYALGGKALLAYLRQHQIPVTVAEKKCAAAPVNP
jgi:S1-C subfamily serine protease